MRRKEEEVASSENQKNHYCVAFMTRATKQIGDYPFQIEYYVEHNVGTPHVAAQIAFDSLFKLGILNSKVLQHEGDHCGMDMTFDQFDTGETIALLKHSDSDSPKSSGGLVFESTISSTNTYANPRESLFDRLPKSTYARGDFPLDNLIKGFVNFTFPPVRGTWGRRRR